MFCIHNVVKGATHKCNILKLQLRLSSLSKSKLLQTTNILTSIQWNENKIYTFELSTRVPTKWSSLLFRSFFICLKLIIKLRYNLFLCFDIRLLFYLYVLGMIWNAFWFNQKTKIKCNQRWLRLCNNKATTQCHTFPNSIYNWMELNEMSPTLDSLEQKKNTSNSAPAALMPQQQPRNPTKSKNKRE